MVAEVSFARRAAPAVLIAVAGGALLYALPAPEESSQAIEVTPVTPSAGQTASPSASPTVGPTAGATVATTKPGPRTVSGDAMSFKFGVIQVDVELDGTTITDIKVVKEPAAKYQQYTDDAVRGMRKAIIAAQSTKVSTVSGATYTSKAYAQSVQSALNKA